MNSAAPRSQLRSRLTLLLIAAMFLGSFAVAAVLFFSGWTGGKGRNFGELLQPPRDLASLQLERADGTAYPWSPEKHQWRIAVAPAPGCTTECARVLDTLHRVWLGQGRKADRIDVLWFGELPAQASSFRRLVTMKADPALLAALPEAATSSSLPVYLIDPKGFLVLHYRAGFDPTGLRKDLGKLVK